jgi:transcriptional regulator with XRE-family HTH domain
MRTASAAREPSPVSIFPGAPSGGGAVDLHDDQERRRRLAAFLLQRRQSVDPRATRVGTYQRRENRIGRPFTQEEVAEALDVSRQWYAALEMGSSIRPSAALLERIAFLFELADDERVMLFRLAIREFLPSVQPATILEGPMPSTAYAAAIRSLAEIDAAADALARIREKYHRSGTAVGMPARPRVIASWDRCRARGVDPTQKVLPIRADVRERRDANERLLRAAGEVVTDLAGQLAGTGHVIVVADDDGTMLEFAGDLDAQRRLAKNAFAHGGDMSEAAVGTNAIGTAIADHRPIQLLAAEHYSEAGVALACTAALICDPTTREIVGVLDITGPYKLVRPHLIGVVMQAALEIEERLALL